METIKDLDLVRAVQQLPVLMRVNAAPDDNANGTATDVMPTMIVDFSVFGTWYEIDSWFEGQFLERTMPGSFKKTIRENRSNIKVLFDHGMDYQIGNKVLGPIDKLAEEAAGPHAEVPMLATSYNEDLIPGLEAGLYGSSFRFRVIKEQWNDEPGVSDYNPKGIPERTILEVKLMEFGPVTFPANPDSTSGIRCLTDDYYGRARQRTPEVYDDLVARTKVLRVPVAVVADTTDSKEDRTLADTESTKDEVETRAAQQETDEPIDDHSEAPFVPTVTRNRVERKAAYMNDYLSLIMRRASRYDD